MKVVRLDFGIDELKRLDKSGFHRYDAILVLQHPSYQKKRMMYNDAMVPFEKLRGNDHVGNAGFVFEAQENKSFGGTRPLTGNHGACYGHKLAVRQLFEMSCGQNSLPLEVGTVLSEWVRPDGQPGSMKIGEETFFGGHGI